MLKMMCMEIFTFYAHCFVYLYLCYLQLKEAMVSILEELTEGDRVNIMTFSSSTSFWRPDVVEVTRPKIIEEAIQHVESIRPGGCKNHSHQVLI